MKHRSANLMSLGLFGLVLAMMGLLLAVAVMPSQAQDNGILDEYVAPAWDGQSRYTIAILGMDRRPGARDTLRVRTDVVLVFSIDPSTQSMGILHIPRDMHFAPAGSSEMARVNTLVVLGEDLQEGYGPYYLMDTLQLNLGMYIDAYIAVDFEAFIAVIDAMGGIEVDVPYAISDPQFPDMDHGYDPFYVGRGLQTFDGRTALKYVRTRHADNDYMRGERQLQVIDAVRQKLSDPLVLQRLIANSTTLYDGLKDNVYTDIPLEQIILLAMSALGIPEQNIHMGALGLEYSFDYAVAGSVVRVPDHSKLPQLLTDVFGENYWQ